MPRTIRFHLDEHCHPGIAVALRQRGIDVTTTLDAGLANASDEDHIAYAAAQGRVIFTQDADFLRLHAAGAKHPGIAYCHPESRSVGEIIRMLALIWEVLEPDDMLNQTEFI